MHDFIGPAPSKTLERVLKDAETRGVGRLAELHSSPELAGEAEQICAMAFRPNPILVSDDLLRYFLISLSTARHSARYGGFPLYFAIPTVDNLEWETSRLPW